MKKVNKRKAEFPASFSDIKARVVERLAAPTPFASPVSLQNQLRDLFAENDQVLSLAKRLQQKLFGQCDTCAPMATPTNLEAWIAEATKTAKEAHMLLTALNERIEAE